MPKYVLDPCVEGELWGVWHFVAQDNPDAATRVIEAAYQTFKTLAANPGMGTKRRFRNPKLRDVRSWRITGFENYLIFIAPFQTASRSFTFITAHGILTRCLGNSEPDI